MNHPTTQIHVEPETMNKPDNTKQTVEYKAACNLDSTTATNSTFGDGTSFNIIADTADINANSNTQSQEGILFKILQSEIERKVEELHHVCQAYHYSRFHNTNLPPDQACFTVLQVHANNFEPRWFRI
ncbi:hypothetical protein BGZ97_007530 [Linnemannia gamsii]|jgi:hypothetical protein|uniref:Uncharacterized protein n=1 Tax=Linnemannia gamsii TaxID=64522 RepID=A0A9P6QQC9_9FUNG|nr:hypothetical protein BGZ97_007530 [Linnemannia gamsii]